MKRVAAGVALLVLSLWATVLWVEAEKEIVVLCGLSAVGTHAAELQRLHGTASFARRHVDTAGPRVTSVLTSAHNLSLTACTVIVEDSVAVASTYHERLRLAPMRGLRRSMPVEDRVPPAALSALAPQSDVAATVTGIVTLLCLSAFLVVLWRTDRRWRWSMAALLLVVINLCAVLLVGG